MKNYKELGYRWRSLMRSRSPDPRLCDLGLPSLRVDSSWPSPWASLGSREACPKSVSSVTSQSDQLFEAVMSLSLISFPNLSPSLIFSRPLFENILRLLEMFEDLQFWFSQFFVFAGIFEF